MPDQPSPPNSSGIVPHNAPQPGIPTTTHASVPPPAEYAAFHSQFASLLGQAKELKNVYNELDTGNKFAEATLKLAGDVTLNNDRADSAATALHACLRSLNGQLEHRDKLLAEKDKTIAANDAEMDAFIRPFNIPTAEEGTHSMITDTESNRSEQGTEPVRNTNHASQTVTPQASQSSLLSVHLEGLEETRDVELTFVSREDMPLAVHEQVASLVSKHRARIIDWEKRLQASDQCLAEYANRKSCHVYAEHRKDVACLECVVACRSCVRFLHARMLVLPLPPLDRTPDDTTANVTYWIREMGNGKPKSDVKGHWYQVKKPKKMAFVRRSTLEEV